MRFKVDENLHPEAVELLREVGHDAVSVWDQQMRGAKDPTLAEACRAEDRALITLDLGFGDIREYPPEQWPGIIVLRLRGQHRTHVTAVLRRLALLFTTLPLSGRLWVVTEQSVRVRGGESDDVVRENRER
jgi:predicted nuclease of predicted toxin-antitoxin system